MPLFPHIDLFFQYRDADPKLCTEISGLTEDEIDAILDALRCRYDRQESGAYRFSIKRHDDYSGLEQVKRKRSGVFVDSVFPNILEQFLAVEHVDLGSKLTTEQRRWLGL